MLSYTELQADPHMRQEDPPAPPKYYSNHAHLKAQKNAVNVNLTGDAPKFPHENHKLGYVYALLEREAMDQVQPYVLSTSINLLVIINSITILHMAFEYPNSSGTATCALCALKQNTDLFTYL